MKLKLPSRQQVSAFFSGLLEKGLVLVIILYIGWSVSRSVMQNYQINQKIQALNDQVLELEQEKAYLTTLIAYYKTDTFKELKAREELGYQKPGEHVIAVPVDPSDIPAGADSKSDFVAIPPPPPLPQPNYVRWYRYFFSA